MKLYIPRDDSELTGEADGVDAAASVAIIKPGDKDGVVDDEGLLDVLNVRQQKTCKTSTLVPIEPQCTSTTCGVSWKNFKIYSLSNQNVYR